MSRYEDAVYSPNRASLGTKTLSFQHHDGALSMLKIWREKLVGGQPPSGVIKHSRRGIIRSALLRSKPLPDWILDGASFGEHGSELEYDSIVARIADIRHRLSMFLKEIPGLGYRSNNFAERVESLNEEARDIDEALQGWISSFPSTWHPKSHILSDINAWPTHDFDNPIVYSYSSTASLLVWTQYYSMRLFMNSTRLRILRLSNVGSKEFSQKQRAQCLSNITAAANDLASSLPFCLGEVRVASDRISVTVETNVEIMPYVATRVIWPLMIASSLADVDMKQRQWFRSELARLGKIVGFGVIEHADTDGWFEAEY